MQSKVLTSMDGVRVSTGNGGIQIRRSPSTGSQGGRTAAAACLVVDCSASMAGNKIKQARGGTSDFALEAVGKGYEVGLVSFDDNAQRISSPSPDLGEWQERVEGLHAGGSTNMTAGLEMALREVSGYVGPRAIVVVTDGLPDDQLSALAAASRAKRAGVDVITIGTDDADKQFLRLLASRDDLVMTVDNARLSEAIGSAALMLMAGRVGD